MNVREENDKLTDACVAELLVISAMLECQIADQTMARYTVYMC